MPLDMLRARRTMWFQFDCRDRTDVMVLFRLHRLDQHRLDDGCVVGISFEVDCSVRGREVNRIRFPIY